ncbi:VF530 family DNA-binding protein [Desulfopila sp. IMCC35008]|uniref:VF530 family DNA-binding protein n=1 Tax=Desulfopila sp. IMCC35008 TaxID=2653858 RepID=UPI0013D2EB3D|nr:VF530 family DNA-binding protein [Desulfopila sp. IMCC35008]
MTKKKSSKGKDPLHGVTLKNMLEDLVEYHGFPYLADKVKIKVFSVNPTFNTSLKFLRKTPWAREKIEKLYTYHFVIRKEKEKPRKNAQ